MLDDTATALEILVRDTLRMMNAGEKLDEILHSVKVPDELLAKPYLRPLYDEPEFIIHNIWRLYGGWYDGNPFAPQAGARRGRRRRSGRALSGGVDVLVARARGELSQAEEFRLACHLIEMAVLAEPESKIAHGARAEIYTERRGQETSLMAHGIFGSAARESETKS